MLPSPFVTSSFTIGIGYSQTSELRSSTSFEFRERSPSDEGAPASIVACMTPKKPLFAFSVDGVQCTVKDGLVNVGLNDGWPRLGALAV